MPTQDDLGEAFMDMAEVKDKEFNLTKAMKAFDEVIKIYTFWDYPSDYAKTRS